MKTYKKYILGAALLSVAALTGCKDKMRELNTNPNTISSTDPLFMFKGATGSWDGSSRYMLESKYSGAMQLMQYIVRYDYGSAPYFNPSKQDNAVFPPSFSAFWSDYYGGRGNQLVSLVRYIDEWVPEDQKSWYQDMRAITQLLNTYQVWRLFDVYGAAVYGEAFQAHSGVLKPQYDLIQDIYRKLDSTTKASIEVLAAPANPRTVNLGRYDFFYGYKSRVTPGTGGATVSPLNDYTQQRKLWLKAANAFRLKMAWRFKAQSEKTGSSHFSEVMTEVLAQPEGLFTSNDESWFFNYGQDHDNIVNDINAISLYYAVTDNFMQQLKRTSDPRLPLLARTNGLDANLTKGYKYIQTNFPQYLNSITQNGTGEAQGIPERTDPTISAYDRVYQGQNISPNLGDIRLKAGSLLTGQSYTVFIKNGSTTGTDTTINLRVASPAQGRYFVKNGGSDGANNSNDGDGTSSEFDWKIQMRRAVITYPEQCLTLAYLTADGVSTGKTAAEWYELGVKAAIRELRDDALRYKIQIAASTSFPKVPGLNDAGLYQVTDPMIDTYLAANPYTDKESVVAQAWVYFYTHAEEMWAWWKLTGYPRAVSIPTQDTPRPAYAYFEQPYTGSASSLEPLVWPRRTVLPGQVENIDNRLKAVDGLLKTPNYGINENNTTGRIWWDLNGI